jgi:hypothetical protein
MANEEQVVVGLVLLTVSLFLLSSVPIQVALVFRLVARLGSRYLARRHFVYTERLMRRALQLCLVLAWLYLLYNSVEWLTQVNLSTVWFVVLLVFGLPVVVYLWYKSTVLAQYAIMNATVRSRMRALYAKYLLDMLPPFSLVTTCALVIVCYASVTQSWESSKNTQWSDPLQLSRSFVTFLIAVGFTPTLRNVLGAATLIADLPFDVGDMVEMRGVAGRLVMIGATGVSIMRAGEAETTALPGADFLHEPSINYTARLDPTVDVQANRVPLARAMQGVVLVLPPQDGPEPEGLALRRLSRGIEGVLLAQAGTKAVSVEVIPAASELTPSSLRFSECAAAAAAFYVSWTVNGPPLPFDKSVKQRSEVLLAVQEYLETIGVQAL